MATEKRSIEISYKADLKDLLSKLKTLPNVTAKEAKQMVGELNKQLKRAEAEAKKTGQAMKKAGQQGAAGFKSAENALRDFKDASGEAEAKLETVADQSGEVDRGFAAIGLALNQVNPALGEAAMKGADVAAVSEGLLLTIRNLNPVILAASAAVAALTLGYASYAEGVKKAGEQTIALREAEKSLRLVQKGIRDNLQGALDDLNALRDEQAVYTGELTKEELERKKATDATRASFDSRIASQKDVIAGLKEDLRIVDMIQKGNTFLSDSEKDRLITLHNQIVGSEKALNLEDKKGKLIVQMKPLQDAISSEIERQGEALDLIVGFQEEAVEIAGTMQEIKEDEARIAEDQADKAQAKAEAEAKAAEEAAKAAEEAAKQLQIENAKKAAADLFYAATLEGEEAAKHNINERYDMQMEKAKELFEFTQDQDQLEETIHGLQKKRIEELADLEKAANEQKMQDIANLSASFAKDIDTLSKIGIDKLEERSKAHEDRINKEFDIEQEHLKAIFKGEEDKDKLQAALAKSEMNRKKELAEADGFFIRNTFIEREEAAKAIFRINQAAAIANIAIQTAENIVKAQGAGPLAPFLIAAAISSGATQAAVVASTPAPSFHMGGLAVDADSGSPFLVAGAHAHLDPDEVPATLLTGEAVLDRTTTRSLGPEGVRRLQNGGTAGEIIIMQPFKHFDRYNKSARKRTGRPLGSAGY